MDILSLGGLIFELMYWAPLIALLLSSLGLVVLKRISGGPPWVQRLTVRPFYFVSLPIAMLTIGMQGLVVYASFVFVMSYFFYSFVDVAFSGWLARVPIILYLAATATLVIRGTASAATSTQWLIFAAFCAAQLVSGRLLWRTLWRGDEREYPLNKAMEHLKALLLLFAFACEFLISTRTLSLLYP